MKNYSLFPQITISLPIAIGITIFLISCGGDGIKNNMPDPNDTTGQVYVAPEPPKPNRDSLAIDLEKSSFQCVRSKAVKDVDKQVKVFGSIMNVKMDNVEFSAETKLDIKNAYWFMLDKKYECGKVVLDMKKVAALKIGEDDKVEVGNPDYLESKKYPTSSLTILSIDSIAGNKKKMQVNAKLQIKDTTANISFPAKLEYTDATNPTVPTKLNGEFHIDGIKWALNPKNAKVTKDDLLFKVVLVR